MTEKVTPSLCSLQAPYVNFRKSNIHLSKRNSLLENAVPAWLCDKRITSLDFR